MAQRSPNYPQISLREALDRIQKVYKGIHTARASESRILELLGYASRSGKAQGVLSAARKYGLLDGKKDSFRVTEDAVLLCEREPTHPEYRNAVIRAAFAPALFAQLKDHFDDRDFTDQDLRVYLISQEFSQRAVDEVIRTYRDTISLVSEATEGYTSAEKPPQKGKPIMEQRAHRYGPTVETHNLFGAGIQTSNESKGAMECPLAPHEQDLKMNVGPDLRARIIFDGPITQEAAEMLAAILEVQKRSLRKEADLPKTPKPRLAVWRNKDVDQPVVVIGLAGVDRDGRHYMMIKGSDTAVPEDEITYSNE